MRNMTDRQTDEEYDRQMRNMTDRQTDEEYDI